MNSLPLMPELNHGPAYEFTYDGQVVSLDSAKKQMRSYAIAAVMEDRERVAKFLTEMMGRGGEWDSAALAFLKFVRNQPEPA